MKKSRFKPFVILISLILSFSLVFASMTTASAAASEGCLNSNPGNVPKTEKFGYNLLDRLITNVVGPMLTAFLPGPPIPKKADFVSENKNPGSAGMQTEAVAGNRWQVGYSAGSLLENYDILDGNHIVAGSMEFGYKKLVTEVLDDTCARVFAISDSSGNGTAVFVALDAFGFPNRYVKEIRSRLAGFSEENNIVSINVSSVHQHSVVDTLGMNGDIKEILKTNPINNILGRSDKNVNGVNPAYLENLYNVVARLVEEAVGNMEPGALYYGNVDAGEYVVDWRAPYCIDENLNRLRFVPDDSGSRETWYVTFSANCGGTAGGGTVVTGDYPYYMAEALDGQGINFIYTHSAQQATDLVGGEEVVGVPFGEANVSFMAAYAEKLVERLFEIENDELLEPMLNVRHLEYFCPIDNQVMVIALKMGMFTNTAVTPRFNRYEVVTEVGYVELGSTLGIALIPGEVEGAIVDSSYCGGALKPAETWTGNTWGYPSMQEIIAGETGRKLICFALCNDQIGYIVPKNNYVPYIAPQSEGIEFVSVGTVSAEKLMGAFIELINI
ncbi:MAG: hypothetical protein FWF08_01265 [Oscillospiraceae bacterium]|nr:hypothetical protein [Oscillospiraceae bacterium]